MYTLTPEFIAESAKQQNRPRELWDFYLGAQNVKDANTYHFCSDNIRLTFWNLDGDVQEYLPLSLTRDGINSNSDMSTDTLSGEFDNADLAWSRWIADPQTGDLRGKRVVVRRIFKDLMTDKAHCKILFDGIVSGVESLTFEKAIISVRSLMNSLDVETGCLQSIDCDYILGDEWCGYVNTPVTGQTIDAGSTTTAIIDAARTEADDYWKDGFITFKSGQNIGQIRTIINFDLATKTLLLDYALPYTPAAGNTYDIRRGCDQAYDTCKNKFANQANFSGCKDIPQAMN